MAAAHDVADEPGFAEDAQMAAHGRPAHRERAGQRPRRVIATAQHAQEVAPDRVGEGLCDCVHATTCN